MWYFTREDATRGSYMSGGGIGECLRDLVTEPRFIVFVQAISIYDITTLLWKGLQAVLVDGLFIFLQQPSLLHKHCCYPWMPQPAWSMLLLTFKFLFLSAALDKAIMQLLNTRTVIHLHSHVLKASVFHTQYSMQSSPYTHLFVPFPVLVWEAPGSGMTNPCPIRSRADSKSHGVLCYSECPWVQKETPSREKESRKSAE